MNEKKDFSDIGEKIRGAIQDAADTGDFSQLNFIVNDTVGSAMEEVRRQVNQVHDRLYRNNRDNVVDDSGNWREADVPNWNSGVQKTTGKSQRAGEESGTRENERNASGNERNASGNMKNVSGSNANYGDRYRSKRQYGQNTMYSSQRTGQRTSSYKTGVPTRYFRRSGNVASILYTVFGAIGTGFCGFWAFLMMIFMIATQSFDGIIILTTAVFGALTAASSVMLGKGCNMRGRLKRAERYVKLLKDKMFMEIDDLAARAGLSIRKVKRDLRIMVHDGTFPEGHMDPQETVLVLKDDLWDQYLIAQKSWEDKKRQAQETVAAQEGAAVNADITAERQIEKDGRAYMQRLRTLNDIIPGEVISNKLYKLDDLLLRIFGVLREHPEKSQQMRKFMDYYLPTTVKLVQAYADFDKSGVQSDNVLNAKAEIEKTMDTINQAFEKLLADMYQDAAFEAAADAKVLKTILAQDGYADNEFKFNQETKGEE